MYNEIKHEQALVALFAMCARIFDHLAEQNGILSARVQHTIKEVKEDCIFSRREMQKMLGLSQTAIIVTLASLLEKKLIVKVGNGNRTKYRRASKI